MFLFLGQDTNDSVIFRDSYSAEDEKLVMELFQRLYRGAAGGGLRRISRRRAQSEEEMLGDIEVFFAKHLAK